VDLAINKVNSIVFDIHDEYYSMFFWRFSDIKIDM